MIEKIKLIVSEVDGIITCGRTFYDELTNTPLKEYSFVDFEVINLLKKEFDFVFLSASNEVNYNLMRKKNIPFYWAPKDKKQTLLKILERYEVTPEEVLYLGCTYSDIPCMNYIPVSLATDRSPASVQASAIMVLGVTHCSVLAELYELIKEEIARRQRCS